jgi:hypothetical protein
VLTFLFEITAKVESLQLDGDTKYAVQGRLSTEESDSEPLAMALVVPEALWKDVIPGMVLRFPQEMEIPMNPPPTPAERAMADTYEAAKQMPPTGRPFTG